MNPKLKEEQEEEREQEFKVPRDTEEGTSMVWREEGEKRERDTHTLLCT
jgi:hypothetical protein